MILCCVDLSLVCFFGESQQGNDLRPLPNAPKSRKSASLERFQKTSTWVFPSWLGGFLSWSRCSTVCNTIPLEHILEGNKRRPLSNHIERQATKENSNRNTLLSLLKNSRGLLRFNVRGSPRRECKFNWGGGCKILLCCSFLISALLLQRCDKYPPHTSTTSTTTPWHHATLCQAAPETPFIWAADWNAHT